VAQLLILLEVNQFGETATFRLSLCSSIMKFLFTPTTMLDHGFGSLGSHKNHVLSHDAMSSADAFMSFRVGRFSKNLKFEKCPMNFFTLA
jgi:hypothetical protein